MFFFIRDWDELLAVPDLDRIMPNLSDLVGRLQAAVTNIAPSALMNRARLRPVLYLCAWTKIVQDVGRCLVPDAGGAILSCVVRSRVSISIAPCDCPQ